MSGHVDICLKLVIIGDSGTGKSCMLRQFLEGRLLDTDDQTTTIGVEFGAQIVDVAGRKVKLQIWDTAGQERYRSVTRSYYRGAAGAIIVYDVTNVESYKNIIQWLDDARTLSIKGKDMCAAIVGNKKDTVDNSRNSTGDPTRRQVSFLEAAEMAQKHSCMFFETSALTGENIEEVFLKLTKSIVFKMDSGTN
ncbi:Ras-related protein Rab [Acrasis kona]|uniref:Ras-related protein Rab n=1 Tax=Acrasis kona TaxID=1008807 RepID=A0AAW2ZEG3_9EUKA